MILFGYPFGYVHAPRQMVTATACDPAASKGACLRPFDRFDHHNKQLYIHWIQTGNAWQGRTSNKAPTHHGGSGGPAHAEHGF
jgi:hypothetical protein